MNFVATALYVLIVLTARAALDLPVYALQIAPVGLILLLIFLNGWEEKSGLLSRWK
jgi:hypothetical protein